jgi:hypothetical protein
MNHKHYIVVSKLFFVVVAVMHLMRALLGLEIMVNGHIIPLWFSWVAVVVAGVLAYSAEKLQK